MVKLALVLAFAATVAAGLPAPGLYVALGTGLAAIATGWWAFANRAAPGSARVGAAAAITVGAIGCLLGAARVALVLAAISRLQHALP